MMPRRQQLSSNVDISSRPCFLPELSPRANVSGCSPDTEKKLQLLQSKVSERQEKIKAVVVSSYVGTMAAHMQNAAMQEAALTAVCKLLASGNGVRVLVPAGVMDAVVGAMTVHESDANIQIRSASAIARAASDNVDCGMAFIRANGLVALTKALRVHIRSAKVVERCLTALVSISSEKYSITPEVGVFLDRANVTAAVAQALLEHVPRVQLQHKGLLMLGHVASGNVAARRDLVEGGGIAAINSAMDEHAGSIAIQATGCWGLSNLSMGGPDFVRELVAAKSVRRLAGAFRRFPYEQELAIVIIDALANVNDAGDEARLGLFNQNGVPTALEAISNHITKPVLVDRALRILCNAMTQGSMFVTKVLAYGGCRPIVDAMREHARRPQLLIQAVCALINAATGPGACKEKLIHCGTIQALVCVMSHHPEAIMLQEVACSALANLAAAPDGDLFAAEGGDAERPFEDASTDPVGSRAVRTSQSRTRPRGAAAVSTLGIVAQHRGNDASTAAQQRGNDASTAARQHQEACMAIIDAGAATAVVATMETYSWRPTVLVEAVAFLRNLAACNERCCEAIMDLGGIERIVKAMETHVTSPSVAEVGCLALNNLVCGQRTGSVRSNRETPMGRILQEGGVHVVLQVLTLHAHSVAPVIAALCTLRNFAVDAPGDANSASASSSAIIQTAGTVIDEKGGVSLIKAALAAFPEEAAVQLHGCAALRNLACGPELDEQLRLRALKAITAERGVDTILRALEAHARLPAVQEQGCGVLSNLAFGGTIALDVPRVVTAVVRAITRSEKHLGALEQAAAFFINLVHQPSGLTAEARSAASVAIECGAVEALCGTLDAQPFDAGLVARCCAALYLVIMSAQGDVGRQRLSKVQGAVQSVGDALVRFPKHPAVQQHGLALLALILEAHKSTGDQGRGDVVGAPVLSDSDAGRTETREGRTISRALAGLRGPQLVAIIIGARKAPQPTATLVETADEASTRREALMSELMAASATERTFLPPGSV